MKLSSENGAIVEGYDKFNADPEEQRKAMTSLGGVKAYQTKVLEGFYGSPNTSNPSYSRTGAPTTPGAPATYTYQHAGGNITIQ